MPLTTLKNALKLVEAELELQKAVRKAQFLTSVKQVNLKLLIDEEGNIRAAFAYSNNEVKDLQRIAEKLKTKLWKLEFQDDKIIAVDVREDEEIPLLYEELDAFVELVL